MCIMRTRVGCAMSNVNKYVNDWNHVCCNLMLELSSISDFHPLGNCILLERHFSHQSLGMSSSERAQEMRPMASIISQLRCN